jgi:hypothetical protein
VLSGFPIEFGWNCDASKAIVFYEELGFLTDAILEAGPKPGIDVTRNIYGCRSDKIVPADVSMHASCYVTVADDSYHEVRV